MKKATVILLYLYLSGCIWGANGELPKTAVIALRFEDQRDKQAETVVDGILEEIANTKKFRIIEKEKIESLLKNHKLKPFSDINKDDIAKIGEEAGADFIFIPSMRKKNRNDYYFYLEALEVETGLTKADMKKKVDPSADMKEIISDTVDYLTGRVLIVELYFEKNKDYFTGESPNRNTTAPSLPDTTELFGPPVTEETTTDFFETNPFFISFSGAYALPLNLVSEDLLTTYDLTLLGDYTMLHVTDWLILSLFLKAEFFTHELTISQAEGYNIYIAGLYGGAGLSVDLPFFRPPSFHLYAGAGYAITFFDPIHLDETKSSGAPVVTGVCDIRYNITEKISLFARVSYSLVIFMDWMLHDLQAGGGLGFRF
ncbi:MAG: hypothetical protein JW881_19360 [Spirochaetales bacterium]|nr:hypothetical protein [Spirochaetales bacterium]